MRWPPYGRALAPRSHCSRSSWSTGRTAAHTASGQIRSLAVLPLANLSRDSEQDYFVDGMTDALRERLEGIGSLRVISRTSSMHYRGSSKPLSEIARELNVDAVVDGSVLSSGDRVRINVELIQCRHGPAYVEQ